MALDLASQVKAGVVWVNCTQTRFDAACGFGGYREYKLWSVKAAAKSMFEYTHRIGCTSFCNPRRPRKMTLRITARPATIKELRARQSQLPAWISTAL